MLLWSR